MKKRVAILESNYIPWKGYFDIISSVDEFILFDHAPYLPRDLSNRNKIKTARGSQWLTIPVESGDPCPRRVREVQLSDPQWKAGHWKTIERNYAQSPHFREYAPIFEKLYFAIKEPYLSEVNYLFLRSICELLGITTKFSRSSDYELCVGATERLVSICQQAGATAFLSAPEAAGQLEPGRFAAARIELSYMDFHGYPEYPQLHPPFEHAVSILDLIFNTGAEAPRFMKHSSKL
jgi:WbqC-like protein family